MSMVAIDQTNCLNCGTPLHGGYCSECGQKATPASPTVHDLLHDASHELLHVDGKIFQSVWLLLSRPGFLTREYFAGRRVRYVSPLRLYLIFSVIFFAIAAVAPSRGNNFTVTVTPSKGETQVDERAEMQKIGFDNPEELRHAATEATTHWLPRTMFVLVPLFAWIVSRSVRKARRTYPEHLYFALHLHAAWFAGAAVSSAMGWVTIEPVAVSIAVVTGVYRVWYVVAAFKRTYDLRVIGAIVRSLLVGVVYFVALLMAMGAIVGSVILLRTI